MIDVSASWEDIITMFVDKVKEFVKVLVVVEGCVEVEEGWVDAKRIVGVVDVHIDVKLVVARY